MGADVDHEDHVRREYFVPCNVYTLKVLIKNVVKISKYFVSFQNSKNAEYYSNIGSADIDASFCNFVPDAPRITALAKSNSDLNKSSDTDGYGTDTKRKTSRERKNATEVCII